MKIILWLGDPGRREVSRLNDSIMNFVNKEFR